VQTHPLALPMRIWACRQFNLDLHPANNDSIATPPSGSESKMMDILGLALRNQGEKKVGVTKKAIAIAVVKLQIGFLLLKSQDKVLRLDNSRSGRQRDV
jgi:hypothetical protein